jgi:hypothetical protein
MGGSGGADSVPPDIENERAGFTRARSDLGELPMICRRLFANHEYRLPSAGQAQLLPGEPLDRRRITSQGADVGGETGVVGFQLLHFPREGIGALALAHELEQPPIPEE